MKEPRTEAQMRAAAMLLTLECALAELYPGRVSGSGSLWERKITLWINDLQEMIVDYTAEDGIRVRVIRSDKSGDSRYADPERSFTLPVDSDVPAVEQFIEDVVLETADSICLDPKMLVQKIFEIAQSPWRLRQALGNIESGIAPTAPFQPG